MKKQTMEILEILGGISLLELNRQQQQVDEKVVGLAQRVGWTGVRITSKDGNSYNIVGQSPEGIYSEGSVFIDDDYVMVRDLGPRVML